MPYKAVLYVYLHIQEKPRKLELPCLKNTLIRNKIKWIQRVWPIYKKRLTEALLLRTQNICLTGKTD